jgi:hypothetical protein
MVQAQKSETIILSCLIRIGKIAHCLCSIPRADILSDLTVVSERLAQMVQFIFLTIFFYAGCHQMIVMETSCL